MPTDKAARRARFEGAWKVIKQKLLDYITGEGMPKDAIERYERVKSRLKRPGGKLNHDMSVVNTAVIIKETPLIDDKYLKAAVLGWGVELLQAFFLVSDDMMDSSIARLGQIAINDSFMLEAAIYYLLKKPFRRESYYVDIPEPFLEMTFQTEMRQLIDLITAPEDEVDLSKFSLKKHSLIVIYKTAYYSFYLPVALAMYMFHIGKIGTDILDNKCSWCVNTALAVCTPEQRRVLDENYGRKDSECERKVKEVFESPEVDLRKRYGVYEEKVYGELVPMIEYMKREVFKTFIDKIYKRTK
ncbi:farnesyl-diphosphate synthase [Armillaria nabsnona]|nr:farnesyl-diphosphate synthase [Armillaria nabsnona]